LCPIVGDISDDAVDKDINDDPIINDDYIDRDYHIVKDINHDSIVRAITDDPIDRDITCVPLLEILVRITPLDILVMSHCQRY
jgi:hypothetical protein